MFNTRILALCVAVLTGAVLSAQGQTLDPSTPIPNAIATPENVPQTQSSLLGEQFSSAATGIAFRTPAGSTRIITAIPDQICEFDNAERKWVFKVSKATFSQAMPLTTVAATPTTPKKDGLLETTADRLRLQTVAQFITQEVIHVGDQGQIPVGLLVLRYTRGNERILSQEAIIQASDRLYYLMELSAPGRADVNGQTDDPDEKLAAQTFNQILDSIHLLDRSAIYQDQADRLIRTRGLYANWTSQFLQKHLIPEQYLRLVRDGVDVGYTLEVQHYLDDRDSRLANEPVIQVIIRSHTAPADKIKVDAKSVMTVTDDRRHETWSNIELGTDATKASVVESHLTELGVFDVKTRPVVVSPNGAQPGLTPNGMQQTELADSATISVTRVTAHGSLKPFKQSAPPFYLPQALSHILPGLLPYKDEKKYAFAVYIAEAANGQPALMMRYIDVQPPQEIKIDGRDEIAIPIADRIGLEGSVTTHYVSAEDGRYLGSMSTVTAADGTTSAIQILPTSLEALQARWGRDQVTMPDNASAGPNGQ